MKFEGSEDSSAGGRFGKDVRVLGRKITEDNCDDVLADIQPGAVKYDMENKILHLYNADLDFADFHHEYDDDENPDSGTNMIIGIDADDDITIDLNGRNRIFTTKDTFDAKKEYVYGLSSGMMNNLTITGEGSLEIAFDKTNEKLNYTGIDAGKGLTINGAAVTVDLGGELAGDGIDCMMCDLEVKNGAVFRISCDGEKSTAADYRMADGMSLVEDAAFELVSDGTAINCYFVSEAVKERGALVNEEPTAEGASAWDKTTFLRKYKYVRFPQEDNHKHQLTQYDAKAATCTEPGNIEYWVCWKCGKYFSDSEGTTEIDPDEIFTQRLEHKWSDWNPIDETKHQRRCAYDTKGTHIQIEDHEWDGGKVIKRATLFNKGVIEYSCDVCGAKKTEEFSLKDVVKDTVAKVVEKIRKWIEKIINGGNDSLSGSKPAYNSKAPNPISASGKTVIVKYKKLKTKDWTFKALSIMKVRKAKGKVSYKLISVSKKKYRKHFSVNEVTGKVKIKKKLRRGSYVLTVRVSAAGNAFYKAGSVKVKFRIKVQ